MNADIAYDAPDCDELSELIVLAGDQALTDQQTARLEELVVGNKEACMFYVAMMHVQAGLLRQLCDSDAADSPVIESLLAPMPQVSSASTSAPHPFCLFADAWQVATAYFDFDEHPARFSYLVASIFFVIAGIVTSHIYVTTRSVQNIAENSPTQMPSDLEKELPPAIDRRRPSSPVVVGRIVDAVDCKWSRNGKVVSGQWSVVSESSHQPLATSHPSNPQSPIPNPQSLVALGDKFILASGLLEIAYDTGANVVLEGPCTFNVETNGGFLAVGRLTGKLDKKVGARVASGSESNLKIRKSPHSNLPLSTTHYPLSTAFVIATPTALVTDLGTEFGVDVDRDRATTINVIRGEVEATRDAANGVPIRERLKAGQAIYIASLNDLPVPVDLSNRPQRLQKRPGGRSVRVVLSPELKASLRQVRDARTSQTVVEPIGVFASAYGRVFNAHGKMVAVNDRHLAFRVVTDDIFGRGVNGEKPRSSFDTELVASGQRLVASENKKADGGLWTVGSASRPSSNPQSPVLNPSPPTTHHPLFTKLATDHWPLATSFVGLRYDHAVCFDRIKVFLGRQEKEGGDWVTMPRIFILKNPVDTDATPPENDPKNWREVLQEPLYGHGGTRSPTPGPGAVFEFALTKLSKNDRTGYGWAVGGVRANGSAGYLSVTELRAYAASAKDKKANEEKTANHQ
jgi:hypothetical protein